jgi:prepilin-type N-terminal cleavage/methylation domain-containing protein
MRLRNSRQGFTLLEMMVTIGIIMLLAITGVHSFANSKGWMARVRLKAAGRDLAMNLQYAKLEAIKRNTLCSVTFGQQVGSTTYSYVVFAEDSASRNLVYDGADVILKQVAASDYKDITFNPTKTGTGITPLQNNTGNLPVIAFNSRGMPLTKNSSTFSGGTIFMSDVFGNSMWVDVTVAGQIKLR